MNSVRVENVNCSDVQTPRKQSCKTVGRKEAEETMGCVGLMRGGAEGSGWWGEIEEGSTDLNHYMTSPFNTSVRALALYVYTQHKK